ncbi:MAG: SIS domain-containing protein [Thermodesulfobacteriota bacterium]|nr:SIS domain-containing protein [Thermodesulfobacteriota bacterium]
MGLKRIKRFLARRGITGLYFGKSLKTVPEGSLVLFPYEPDVLSCGITGVLSFKGRPAGAHGLPIQDLEDKIEALSKVAGQRLEEKGPLQEKDDLGTTELIGETKHLCQKLREHRVFYEVFSRRAYQKRLTDLCEKLEAVVESEDMERARRIGRLAAEECEALAQRITELRDILWSLRHEIIENIEKITALGRFDQYDCDPLCVGLLKEVNIIFNNLDRLEVRGRDSAGLSLLFVMDEAAFTGFRQALKEASLLGEFEERQGNPVLLNRSIVTNKQDTGVSVIFTYKVAAEVGNLGDNVRYLRNQVRDDLVLQHCMRCSHVYHSAVAHTRWASVGEISEANCHPVDSCPSDSPRTIHVCLNGDIDNYQSLRQDLERETGKSIPEEITTDTKIIPLQIEKYLNKGETLEGSFRLAVSDFEGSHAIAMHSDLAPGQVFLAQRGSGQAIFVGLAEGHYVPASEIYGLVEETSCYVKMDGEKVVEGISGKTQGQIFVLDGNSEGGLSGLRAMYYDGTPVELSGDDVKETEITPRDIDRQHYPHYFLKEVSESPRSVEQTIEGRVAILEEGGRQHPQILLDTTVIPAHLEADFREHKIRRVFFMGQGTAGVAASACAVFLREYLSRTEIRVASFKASEFSAFVLEGRLDDALVVAITQSGTTTDTNRAIDMARERGACTLAIVNRRDSDITFKVDGVLYTSSGRDIEMSVASTKAYYSQIVAGSILGLKLGQLAGSLTEEFILAEIEHLWKLPSSMRKVLERHTDIGESAERFAVTKTYWAIVGSGPNKVSADEIRIKLSELCYKTISSDVVEDKKHIDLSSEPLIFVCAAGNREDVVSDIVKDTAIFKAHQAVPIVVATEGEHRFDPYADAVISVPDTESRFAPIINTLAGHLWGYYAALAINKESRYLVHFREEIREHIQASTGKGLDVYEIVLDEGFREKAAEFYGVFKERIRENRYATAMAIRTASDLTLLLKYLAGRLPISDFEFDFGTKGTAPNMLRTFFECIGKIVNELVRPIDAIKHQAKTVTVGTSRISEKVEGLLFKALENQGFSKNQITTSNVLVLKRLQEVLSEIAGTTLYKVAGLNILGEPVADSTIHLLKKEGSAEALVSRVETDNRLRGTKRIIVKNGNIFIGKGRMDNRSILAVPIMSTGTKVDHLLLFNVAFKAQVELQKKVDALGGKYHHIRNIVEETSLAWKDQFLELLDVEQLFGMSAEKISEAIVSSLNNRQVS